MFGALTASTPLLVAALELFIKIAIPVIRRVFPAITLRSSIEWLLLLKLSMMTVWSDPVVLAPPSVAETAPMPWIVTEWVKEPARVVVPVQVQVPDGIAIMSPSAGLAKC